jgi:hypothetical protein
MVVKIFEKNAAGIEINRMYIFYDHNLSTFGIRGGNTSKQGKITSYSYYTDHISGATSMVNALSAKFVKLSICLVNYSNLPADSNNITYDLLLKTDIGLNEMVGFDFDKKFFDKKESSLMFREVEKYLRLMTNVYNDY